MQSDKVTQNDLSIFHPEEEQSVFHYLNFTNTAGGKEWLRILLSRPLPDVKQIKDTQQLLGTLLSVLDHRDTGISNGTIMVVQKFYETAFEEMPREANSVNSFLYKLVNGADFSLIKYSVEHFIAFIKGINQLYQLLNGQPQTGSLAVIMERINMLLQKKVASEALALNNFNQLPQKAVLHFGFNMRRYYKHETLELIDIYCRIDAYFSLAAAIRKFNLAFPVFLEQDTPQFEAKQLYHPLLTGAVSYDVCLDATRNFVFLTGANMAGKSTFIKAVGVAAYLAHIGMAVPAQSMRLTLYDGLLSNIQVTDNIVKGESYFFNEVQRIRKTIEKISDGRKWLTLIDELFKGTNVQDAMRCSTAVIEGLRKMSNGLFIVSTHLYEISEQLKQYPNIQFRYFETSVVEDQLIFNYKLQEGISNDRLGYLILKREGVVDLLEKL